MTELKAWKKVLKEVTREQEERRGGYICPILMNMSWWLFHPFVTRRLKKRILEEGRKIRGSNYTLHNPVWILMKDRINFIHRMIKECE
jgi:hypothetical protein